MAIVTDNYYLSLTQDNRVLRVRCSQGDSSRNINLILYNNGNAFTIPSGVSASVRGVRQNGSVFSKSCSIMQGRTGVVLALNAAINGVAGVAVAEIVLTDGSGNKVGTSNFIIQVESNLLLRGTVEVGEESPVEYISDLIDVIDALNARVNNIVAPSGDASLSEVVDARLSGYSGTTYQNLKARIDADFASIDNSKADKSNTYTKTEVDDAIAGVEILTDATLSVSEAAADAKATGDAISALNESLGNMETATAGDVGKALKAKTVTGGKVTEWEFGDTNLPENIAYVEPEYNITTLIDHATAGKSVQSRSVNLTQGQTAVITVTTESNGLTLQLTKNNTVVQTIIENNSHVATTDEVFEFIVEADADKLKSWSNGNNTITLQTKELVSSALVDKDGEEIPAFGKYVTKEEFDTLTTDVNAKIGITNKAINWHTLLSDATFGGTKDYPCNISAGTHLYITVTTNGRGLSLLLLDGETIIDTIIDNGSHVATADEHFEWVATADCNTFRLWTGSTFTLNVQTRASVSGTVIDSDGQMVVMDAEQVDNLDATRNYVIEAQSMNFPRFVSGLYLDIGRKYYTKTNLLTILDEMAEAEMNTIFFHFSETEGFRFGLDDMTIRANGTTYDLSVSLGKGIHGYGDPEDNNNYITQTEMTEIIAYAKSLGIEVVPCLDMPSHMGCILKDFKAFWSSSTHTISLSKPLAVNFVYAVLEKYLDYFQSQRCGYWCLGADEVHGYNFATDAVSAGLFVDFCNTAIKKIIRHGMLPLMFNDNIGMTNIEDKINKGVIVLYWRKQNDLGAQEIADMGYRVLNMSDGLYYVAGRTSSLNPSSFNVFKVGSGVLIDTPIGGNISIWHDNAGGIASANDGGDAAVADTAQYISDFGAVMKTQKKKVTVTVLESVTIHAGGIGVIPVTLTGTYSLKTMYDAYVSNKPSLKYIGFRNVSCETDPINGTIKNGTVEICMINTGESDVSLNTSNSVGIDFL